MLEKILSLLVVVVVSASASAQVRVLKYGAKPIVKWDAPDLTYEEVTGPPVYNSEGQRILLIGRDAYGRHVLNIVQPNSATTTIVAVRKAAIVRKVDSRVVNTNSESLTSGYDPKKKVGTLYRTSGQPVFTIRRK